MLGERERAGPISCHITPPRLHLHTLSFFQQCSAVHGRSSSSRGGDGDQRRRIPAERREANDKERSGVQERGPSKEGEDRLEHAPFCVPISRVEPRQIRIQHNISGGESGRVSCSSSSSFSYSWLVPE